MTLGVQEGDLRESSEESHLYMLALLNYRRVCPMVLPPMEKLVALMLFLEMALP